MVPEVQLYLKSIITRENYLQLLEDLFMLCNETAPKEDMQGMWKQKIAFCNHEIIPNIDFLISTVQDY